MIVRRVALRNFKSHPDAEFRFDRGLNLLLGPNGAGKTSVLEAIGWVLYDHVDHTKDDLVRRGAKVASCTVELSDGVVYHRDTKGIYTVTGPGVECKGKEDVLSYTKERLKTPVEPSKIFSDIVGVRQSFQIAQFMQTPRERKNTFDEMFAVNVYDEIWRMLKPVVDQIERESSSVSVDIAKGQGALEGATVSDRLSSIKSIIDALESKRPGAELSVKNIESERQALEKMRLAVQERERVVSELEKSERDLADFKSRLATANALEEERESANTRIEELGAVEAAVASARALETESGVLKRTNEGIVRTLAELDTEFHYLMDRQKDYDRVKSEAEKLMVLDSKYQSARESKMRCVAEEQSILRSIDKAKSHVCPLTDAECHQDVEGVLKSKLDACRIAIQRCGDDATELASLCSVAKNATFDLKQLEKERDELRVLKKRISELVMSQHANAARIAEISKSLESAPRVEQTMEELGRLRSRLMYIEEFFKRNRKLSTVVDLKSEEVSELRHTLDSLGNPSFSQTELQEVSRRLIEARTELNTINASLDEKRSQLKSLEAEKAAYDERMRVVNEMQSRLDSLKGEMSRVDNIRTITRAIPEKVVAGRLGRINSSANEIYNAIADEPSSLGIDSEYEIYLEDSRGRRSYSQLSGGESMVAAVCIRMAILRETIHNAFLALDEPTQNLDDKKKLLVAEAVGELGRNNFIDQMIVVTHDDAFNPYAQNVIEVKK